MNLLKKSGITVVLLVLFVSCQKTFETEAPDAPALRQIRGVWITNIDSDVMFSRQKTAEAMRYLHERGFNVVFPVVWNDGYTLYPSDVMASHFGEPYRIDPAFAKPPRDPLQDIIVEARKYGMEVIPWFEFGFSSSYQQDGGHILEAKPHWAARNNNGALLSKNGFEWMNAFHPEVQEFILALVAEVIKQYDIDGIQGDDRLPALPSESGYSDYTRILYKRTFGEDPPDDPKEERFLQWKADQLSDFGGRMYRMVKSYDPDLVVSLSPNIHDWAKREYLQDWPEWIRRGQVDLIHPQVYRYDIDTYLTTLREQQHHFHEALKNRPPDVKSAGPVFHAPGVLIKVGDRYNGPSYIRRALAEHEKLGLDGEVYFFYEGLHENNQNLGDSLYVFGYYKPAQVPYRAEQRRYPAHIVTAEEAQDHVLSGIWYLVDVEEAYGGSMLAADPEADGLGLVIFPERSGIYDILIHIPYQSTDLQSVRYGISGRNIDYSFVFDPSDYHEYGWILTRQIPVEEGEELRITLERKGKNPIWYDAIMLQRNLHHDYYH